MNNKTFETLTIDPYLLINPETFASAKDLFDTNPTLKSFTRSKPYFGKGNNPIIKFTHTILCKPQNENNAIHYRIVPDEASFKHNTVDKAGVEMGTLIFVIHDELVFQPGSSAPYLTSLNPPLIAKYKITKTNRKIYIDDLKDSMINEYGHAKSGHLKAEEPIFIDLTKNMGLHKAFVGISVQRKMPGIELFALIRLLTNKKNPMKFTGWFRLMLTLELLKAFQAQVLEQKINHGDLKPENVMIDLGEKEQEYPLFIQNGQLNQTDFQPTFPMNIIDFEGASNFNETRSCYRFTPHYAAPELLTYHKNKGEAVSIPATTDELEDMHGVGKIIGEIWGIYPDQKIDPDNKPEKESFVNQQIQYFHTHSNEPNRFLTTTLPNIYKVIANLTLENPKNRWCFQQAWLFFQMAQERYEYDLRLMITQTSKPSTYSPTLFPTGSGALTTQKIRSNNVTSNSTTKNATSNSTADDETSNSTTSDSMYDGGLTCMLL